MVDINAVTTVAGSAAEKIKYYGETAFQLTKSSFNLCREKVDTDKLLDYASSMAVYSQNILTDARNNTRFYLRPDHLDMFLKTMLEQIIKQDRVDLKLTYVFDRQKYIKATLLVDHYYKCGTFSKSNMCFNDLLAKIIWYEFDGKAAVDYLPKVDGKMKNWNKRVNERELVQKLGSPADWDIFYDLNRDACEIENIKHKQVDDEAKDTVETNTQNFQEIKIENVKLDACIDHLQKAEYFKKRVMGSGDSFLTNQLSNDLRQPVFNIDCAKQKKRNSVLHSIKKIFKSEKTASLAKPNNAKQEAEEEKAEKHDSNHKSDAQKNVKTVNRDRAESDLAKCNKEKEVIEPVCSKEKQTNAPDPVREDADKNSLMIHIPSNVQKIVLIKDGHKIKIEI